MNVALSQLLLSINICSAFHDSISVTPDSTSQQPVSANMQQVVTNQVDNNQIRPLMASKSDYKLF